MARPADVDNPAHGQVALEHPGQFRIVEAGGGEIAIASIAVKASAAPRELSWYFLRTPMSTTRALRMRPTFKRHNSLAQPNGNRRPSRSAIASFRLGRLTAIAAGTPSTSTMLTSCSEISGFMLFAKCLISAAVKGTKPQLPDQASLKISRMISSSA